MTSLFETVREAALPVELMTREWRGGSLLEFMPAARAPEPELQAATTTAEPELVVDERALQVAAMIEAAREEAGAITKQECDRE